MYYNVELSTQNVTLSVSVTKKLKKQPDILKNFGFIEVSTGFLNDEDCFYDNLEFFMTCSKKEFQKECGEELKDKGFEWREVYRQINKLIKKAVKLNLLTLEQIEVAEAPYDFVKELDKIIQTVFDKQDENNK